MKELFEVEAKSRGDVGKGASRRLRRTGRVPGIIYGAHQDPAMIDVSHSEMLQHLEHEAFYSHILDLKVDGKSQQVILKDLQRHPAKPFVMHVDFQRVSAKEKLKINVPLHFINEETAPGVKKGGAVSHLVTDVEVSCLPKDLPEFIEVDIGALEIGDVVMMSGINMPKGVELTALAAGDEYDVQVASVHVIHEAQEEEPEGEVSVSEVPVVGEED
ncbi:MAG: 50S ribosomal protein L25 [Sedimenticola sp.]|jgi:large subunit ribosomal protein L25|nr:MAG: 50S ribosomal protein L25 [Sedimenticola sp.]